MTYITIVLEQEGGNTEHISKVTYFEYDSDKKELYLEIDYAYVDNIVGTEFENVVECSGYLE